MLVARFTLTSMVVTALMCPACRSDRTQALVEVPPQTVVELSSAPPITFRYIKPGSFVMGKNGTYVPSDSEKAAAVWIAFSASNHDEGPRRETEITRGFYMAATKIRVDQFCAYLNESGDPDAELCAGSPWSRIERSDDRWNPREGCASLAMSTMSWAQAVRFCAWLSDQTGQSVRLPTEAEWEYAAGGIESRNWPWGDVYEETASYHGPSRRERPELFPNRWSGFPVGAFPANATPEGLLDTHLRPFEWCSDYYASAYDLDDRRDPTGPEQGDHGRVMRGAGVTNRESSPEVPLVEQAGVFGLRPVIEVDDEDLAAAELAP